MPEFTVNLTTHHEGVDEDLLDVVLDRLLAEDALLGPALGANLVECSIGLTTNVVAADGSEAAGIAVCRLLDALDRPHGCVVVEDVHAYVEA